MLAAIPPVLLPILGKALDAVSPRSIELAHKIVDLGRLRVARRVIIGCYGFEMRLAAGDFGGLAAAERVGEQAALGLDDEVHPLPTVLLDEHGPVGVVGPERR